MNQRNLIFLKLGGSLITDKDTADKALISRIDAIAVEIIQALQQDPSISLLLGHGSGSFGHHAADKYDTHQGVVTDQQWYGFCEVAARARALNQIVIERLCLAGVRALSISPCSSIHSDNRLIQGWDASNIQLALENNLVPVIYGDVIFDKQLGGTIFSTEELFAWLAPAFHPQRILLSGLEPGIWQDYPLCTKLLDEFLVTEMQAIPTQIQGSRSTDVTGGMLSKVKIVSAIINKNPAIETLIFSGVQPGNIYSALLGQFTGTRIRSSKG